MIQSYDHVTFYSFQSKCKSCLRLASLNASLGQDVQLDLAYIKTSKIAGNRQKLVVKSSKEPGNRPKMVGESSTDQCIIIAIFSP